MLDNDVPINREIEYLDPYFGWKVDKLMLHYSQNLGLKSSPGQALALPVKSKFISVCEINIIFIP